MTAPAGGGGVNLAGVVAGATRFVGGVTTLRELAAATMTMRSTSRSGSKPVSLSTSRIGSVFEKLLDLVLELLLGTASRT